MMRIATLGLAACLLAGPFAPAAVSSPAPGPGAQGSADPAIQAHFEAARADYSGENARDVVAFVEKFWRSPGNEGFNASIERVVEVLEATGYVREDRAEDGAPLTYRIERWPLERPTWEPVDGSLDIVGGEQVLRYATNRNMIASNSYSTPAGGVEAEVVYVGDGSAARLDEADVSGKIVFADASTRRLFGEAIQRGAIGVLSYSMPSYTQPEKNRDSIQFSSVTLDADARAWGIRLSYAAREQLLAALDAGPTRLRVQIETRIYDSEELTLVADVHGRTHPDERFVYSAHLQEPGANDNASGVGAQAEIARVIGGLVRSGRFTPARSISMIWGDEISSTRRYLEDDPERTEGVLWGMSLDMVGEDTAKTGGTFLIEKMPDPSAIWTRGEDKHTEWGSRPMGVDDMTPHYFNDFVLSRCLEQAAGTGWVVETNPYEGGSDHVPFLRAGRPGLLLWHFTDQFYHTDGDRMDKVSATTLANVGISALVSAMTLTTASGETARFLIGELEAAALQRLETEYGLSRAAVDAGDPVAEQALIVRTWTEWYEAALQTTDDIEVGGASPESRAAIDAAVERVTRAGQDYARRLSSPS